MKKVIIAIHGLGNKPPRNLLGRWWKRAINEGLRGINRRILNLPFSLVYWADIMHPAPLKSRGVSTDDPNYLKEPYVKSAAEPVSRKPSLKSRLFRYVDEHMDTIFLNNEISAGIDKITDRIIHHYFSDLETYYSEDHDSLIKTNHNAAEDIRNRLHQTLRKNRKNKIILIAHSMGSIVAFDVLLRFASELNVHTLVTIGSPLGLPFVKERIFNDQKSADPSIDKPHTPNCVGRYWFNLSDPDDKVAMDRSLADDYSANNANVGVIDKSIFNNYQTMGKRNAHKSYGYLRSQEMAHIIADFFSSSDRPKTD